MFQWHSHEMLYGYSMAVIAGFLLTAVMNWTGVQTARGWSLGIIFSLWALARVLFSCGDSFLLSAALADCAFSLALLIALAVPIFKARQWRQIGILSKIVLLGFGNVLFYLGAIGIVERGMFWGVYGALYLIVALILTIAGRVFPAFVRNGVDAPAEIENPRQLSVLNLVLFVVFFINQLWIENQTATGLLAIALCFVNTRRLIAWHVPGIWSKPLLWSLYLSFVSIDVGFMLWALTAFGGISPYLAVHAFAVGGIGLATLGMMARVILGHTGRDIRRPSPVVTYALIVLCCGVMTRVVAPLLAGELYRSWIFISQLCWIVAFALFCASHARMLMQPRVDGQAG